MPHQHQPTWQQCALMSVNNAVLLNQILTENVFLLMSQACHGGFETVSAFLTQHCPSLCFLTLK